MATSPYYPSLYSGEKFGGARIYLVGLWLHPDMANWVRWGFGALLGVAAFLATALLVNDFVGYTQPANLAVELNAVERTAWYQLSAHHVPIAESLSTPERVSVLRDASSLIGVRGGIHQFLYLLPPIPLYVAGLVFAMQTYKSGTAGVYLAAGYLPACLLLAWLSSVSTGALGMSASIGPGLTETFFIAGLAYPLFFGALGGLTHFAIRGL
jgi:hypothetical protein